MNKIALSAFSALLLSSCSSLPLSEQAFDAVSAGSLNGYSPVSNYELGKKNLSAHNYGNAITAFLRELEIDPNSIATLNGLAIAYNEIGRQDVATDYWERALGLDPNSEITLNNLAYLNLKRGDNETALAYAKKAQMQTAAPADAGAQPSIVSVIARNIAAASERPAEAQRAEADSVLPSEADTFSRNGVEKIDEDEWQLRTAATLDSNQSETVRITVSDPEAPTLVTSPVEGPTESAVLISQPPTSDDSSAPAVILPSAVSIDAPANDPTVVMEVVPVSNTELPQSSATQTSVTEVTSSPATATFETLANDPTVVMQPLPITQPDVPLSAQLSSGIEETSLTSVASIEAPANDPTVVMGVAPVSNTELPQSAATQTSVTEVTSSPATATFETLANDPTVVMQPLPVTQPDVPLSAQLSSGIEETSLTSVASIEAPANDPTVVMGVAPVSNTELPQSAATQTSVTEVTSSPATATFETLANDPTVVMQPLPVTQPDVPPSAQLSSGIEETSLPSAVSIEARASDPTVEIEACCPSSRLSSVPRVVPYAQLVSEGGARNSTKGRSIEDLMNDPSVVVQRLPGIEASLRPSVEAGSYIETSSLDSSTTDPAQTSEALSSNTNLFSRPEFNAESFVQGASLSGLNNIELRISNGSGREDMAQRFAGFISDHGIVPDLVTNATSFDYTTSYVFYNPGLLSEAEEVAGLMPIPVKLVEAKRGLGSVEVILGSDFVGFDNQR